MKKVFKTFAVISTLILLFTTISYAQNNDKDKGKSHYTREEIKQMCGVPVDLEKMKKVLARQDSMYNDYLGYRSQKNLKKTATIPNWHDMMSAVENQGSCGSCWVHAATGATEGQLHILYGSNINIDLDESEIPNACDGSFPSSAESYISTYKISSEVGSYPNLQGVKWDVNSHNTISGINAIKNALVNGPVTACFYVYDDFEPFFSNNPQGVYQYDGYSVLDGAHAVVIVSYSDAGYWLCKNSWGSSWGDGGYFRIAYGQCGIESYENSYVSVNQSCYAKITPNLISSLTTAINYGFVNNEWAYLYSGSNALSGTTNSIPKMYPKTWTKKRVNLMW